MRWEAELDMLAAAEAQQIDLQEELLVEDERQRLEDILAAEKETPDYIRWLEERS